MNALVIANTQIRKDADGRYCLNDLHQAGGGAGRHKPDNWLRSQQAQELVAELADSETPFLESEKRGQPVAVIQGGLAQGTYAVKELVYAYAMWISAAFHLHVIRAYDAMVQGDRQAEATPRLPEAPPHRADVLVAASRAFGALVRAGRTLRMGHARSLRSANAATLRATGVDLLEELGADDLVAEPPAGLLGQDGGEAWDGQGAIEAWLADKSEVSTRQVLREVLDAAPDDRVLQTRVGTLLTRLGWRRYRRRHGAGELGYFYARPH